MAISSDIPPQIYNDIQGLSRLRLQAQENPDAALQEVAQQFESIFTRMMIKAMRATVPENGFLSGQNSKIYQDMYDEQLSIHLTSGPNGGLGLADMLVRQLGGAQGLRPVTNARGVQAYQQQPTLAQPATVTPAPADQPSTTPAIPHNPAQLDFDTPRSFIQQLLPYAKKAAQALGTQPGVLIAQAALETGWGQSILQQNAQSSFNLFNIKADQRWDGARVNVQTLEYKQGQPVQEKAAFRRYASVADSFNDYVDFIRSNPRYAQALQQAADPDAYIQELHQAGYATDPQYAQKIQSILHRESFQQAIQAVNNGMDLASTQGKES